jgi:transcriptional regulator with XRE-family HTH domain
VGFTTQRITLLWHLVVDSYQQGLTWGVLTSDPPGKSPSEGHRLPPMTTPLQAARRARGWSQVRAVSELVRLATWKEIHVASAASLKTQLSRWENGHVTPDYYQALLCEIYKSTPGELGFGIQELSDGTSKERSPGTALIAKREWTRDDLSSLSVSFDNAISRSVLADIEMLAHEWIAADTPQLIELSAGRRIGDSLVETTEHRVIQLRRADDYMSGRTSRTLVHQELQATTKLLDEATLTEDQTRRLLTATGELAQLAAWVTADAGLYRQAASYAEGGILAAHAANNAPLAGNIISTLSYQLANTGNPRQAAMLARTAYAGARHSATDTTKALLLERVAWADAKSGDLVSCERALGQVEDNFDHAKPGDDPDWVYWLNREEIDVMAGRCFTELKQPGRAEPLLRNATSGYDNALIRENSLYLSWLAEDYILLNEVELAVQTATRVLELGSRANSARTDERLRHLARLLRRYKDVQSAADFLDQYKNLSPRTPER